MRKALLSYGWDNKEQPKKDGREDPLDALRYDAIIFNWSDPTDQGYKPRRGKQVSKKRKVTVGSGTRRAF